MKNDRQINLNLDEYKDKVYACWVGKNIGGTMGTPYEGQRAYLDIKGFSTKPNEVLPNDDLDLQLIWLHAMETIGPHCINASTLGEFWLSFITPNWNEYGIGKNNMRRGLIPPLSGDYHNKWRHSNGAWIRTEIWACLAPGYPNIAAKYAIEDAMVDHGSGEGTYAAAFVAGMQSAAFVIKDIRKCIDIGLRQIPDNSRVADSVRFVMECYDQGMLPKETRDAVLARNRDIGDGWFEAPSNVAYMILGLLYGEGDFKKSMIAAINCGDDTDCTGATVGATMGILGGIAGVPEEWRKHIGDTIAIGSLKLSGIGRFVLPTSCTQLTDRIVKQVPHMLSANYADLQFVDTQTILPDDLLEQYLLDQTTQRRLANLKPYMMHFDFTFFSVDVTLADVPDIVPLQEIKVYLRITNRSEIYDDKDHGVDLRWWLPEGFEIVCGRQTISVNHADCRYPGYSDAAITIRTAEVLAPVNRCVLEIVAEGHHTPMYIPITLLA